MENIIACPNCCRVISTKPFIRETVKTSGTNGQSIVCDCGKKISYWLVNALLREQEPQ